MDSNPGSISYAKNGQDLGECFQVERSSLEDKALFPHILTKNTSFEVNFGGRVSDHHLRSTWLDSCSPKLTIQFYHESDSTGLNMALDRIRFDC